MRDQLPGSVAGDVRLSTQTEASEKRLLQALLWALKPLTNMEGSLPLPAVTTFLLVALDEGKGVGAYARATGMHRAAMSRYLHGIAGRARNGGPGLGLVTVESHPNDQNRRQVLLTAKGRALTREIFRQLRRSNGPSSRGSRHRALTAGTLPPAS